MTSYLATENLIVEQQPAVIESDGGQDPNFPPENTLDGLTWTFASDNQGAIAWDVGYDFGVPVTADCAGIAGHSFGKVPGTFAVSYSDDGVAWTTWFQIANIDKPTAVFLVPGDPQTRRYWRYAVLLDAADVNVRAGFAVAWLGLALEMQHPCNAPLRPPGQNFSNQLLANFGGGGQLLGTGVLRQGGQSAFNWSDLSWAWWEANMSEHYDRIIQGKPYMFSWDNEGHPDQAAYAVSPNNPDVSYNSHGRMAFSLNAQTL